VLLDPVTHVYDFLIPELAEPAIRRMFQHFATPAELLNEVLQLRFHHAGGTLLRFVVNSSVGVVGLFDFARCEGFVHHHADFGQTLAKYGIPSGPYLIVPIFGPSNVRDGIGDLVDGFLHPARYFPRSRATAHVRKRRGTGGPREALQGAERAREEHDRFLRGAAQRVLPGTHRRDRGRRGPRHRRPAAGESDAPCTPTLDSAEERHVGGPVPRGLPADPVSRWRHPTSSL
jgi:hypothetical protein